MALGNKELCQSWLDFLREPVKRGVQMLILVTINEAPALIRAIEEIFPSGLLQRARSHKTFGVTWNVRDGM